MFNYLLELKNRVLFILLTLVSFLVVSYCYKEILLFLILKSSIDKNNIFLYFIFTDLTELFSVYIKLISFITLQVLIFSVIYQVFVFLSPALFKKEYNLYKTLLLISILVWLLSILISNYVLIPLSWDFFLSFHTLISTSFISLHFEPKISEYLNFCLSIYYTVLLIFQLFILIFVFFNNHSNGKDSTKKYRKFYYFGFVLFSTIVSPPDVFSQICISSCFILMYEFLVVLLIFKNLIR